MLERMIRISMFCYFHSGIDNEGKKVVDVVSRILLKDERHSEVLINFDDADDIKQVPCVLLC